MKKAWLDGAGAIRQAGGCSMHPGAIQLVGCSSAMTWWLGHGLAGCSSAMTWWLGHGLAGCSSAMTWWLGHGLAGCSSAMTWWLGHGLAGCRLVGLCVCGVAALGGLGGRDKCGVWEVWGVLK